MDESRHYLLNAMTIHWGPICKSLFQREIMDSKRITRGRVMENISPWTRWFMTQKSFRLQTT